MAGAERPETPAGDSGAEEAWTGEGNSVISVEGSEQLVFVRWECGATSLESTLTETLPRLIQKLWRVCRTRLLWSQPLWWVTGYKLCSAPTYTPDYLSAISPFSWLWLTLRGKSFIVFFFFLSLSELYYLKLLKKDDKKW